MSKKKFDASIRIRGDKVLNIRQQCRGIGEATGWKVDEKEVEELAEFDKSEGKMLTWQVYSQDFDDPAARDEAVNELYAAINQISTIAVVICPDIVSL